MPEEIGYAAQVARRYLEEQGLSDLARHITSDPDMGIPIWRSSVGFDPFFSDSTYVVLDAICLGHVAMGHHCVVRREHTPYIHCEECLSQRTWSESSPD